jgi:hypothetical protein
LLVKIYFVTFISGALARMRCPLPTDGYSYLDVGRSAPSGLAIDAAPQIHRIAIGKRLR